MSMLTSQLKELDDALNGQSRLPMHELPKTTIEKPNARIRPLPTTSGDLNFSAWGLAHAIKKADCARWPSPNIGCREIVGHIAEHAALFDWGKLPLCLKDGMSTFYFDSSRSSLAGRIGQGMALLFLEKKGYNYVGRFETVWRSRAATKKKRQTASKFKAPDFIVADASNNWVLAEAKGGFVPPETNPNIKGALKSGLSQLIGWETRITPQPIKSYVIGTYLRESGDTNKETSVITFVDPEPEPPYDPVAFPTDAVRRANYASWISLMGFREAADRVRAGSGETQSITIPVIELRRHKYALSVISVSRMHPDLSSREFWKGVRLWPFGPFDWFETGIRIQLAGLNLDVLNALGSAQNSEAKSVLMELDPEERFDEPIRLDDSSFYGSVFSDGSLFGELRLNPRGGFKIPFEWKDVEF